MISFLLITLCGNLHFHLFFFLPVQKLEIKCETFQISTSRGFVCVCMYPQLLSRARLFAILWTVAHQASLSMGILQARILEWVAMSFLQGIFTT